MQEITPDLFINPNTNLHEGDSELETIVNLSKIEVQRRWGTQAGNFILSRWKANGFDRTILEDMVGKYYDHIDIRGIPLLGESLNGVDLSNVDLYAANLENSTFNNTDLTNSWFSETNLKGTKFNWAKMNGVLIDNVDFDHKTSFSGVNLNSINFTLASLLQDLAIGQQRIEHLKQRHPFLAKFLQTTCDYGRSFNRFLFCCFLTTLFFSLIYMFIPNLINEEGFWNCFYFSITIFTTLGYGDIYPISTLGRMIVITEVSIGYLMLGLLIAILTRRTIGG